MKRILLSVLFFIPFLAGAQSLNISWVDAIGGSGNEVVQSTVVDASGNVYIAGSFEGVVNFNPNGTTTNLTSFGLKDAFFGKYTTAGVLVWVKQLGAAEVDEVYALAVDGTNVYVAGYYNGTVNFNPGGTAANLTASGSNDIFYGKYLSFNGTLVWANVHGSTGFDAAVSIKVDGSANVYVTGYFNGTVDFDASAAFNNKVSAGSDDIFLMKLSSTGALGWIDTFGSTGSDIGLTVDVDNSNVYVGGSYAGTIDLDPGGTNSNTGNIGGNDGFFGKYNSTTGALVWWATVRSTGDDQVNSIVLNGTNFYLGGIFSTAAADFYSSPSVVTKASNGGTDIFIAKYNGSGSLPVVTWLNTIGGISDDRSNLLTLDASANVYSTGSFDGTVDFDPSPSSNTDLGSIGLTDIYVASYSSGTGAIRFAKAAGSTSDEEGTTVAVDGSGNVYVGGYFQGITSFDFNSSSQDKSSLGSWDAFVAKYAQSAFAPEPTTQPPSLQVVDLQSTQFTYDVTAATGFNGGYLHIYKVGSAPTALPVDGIEYFAGDILSDGSIVKYSDKITAGNFYGSLTPGTAYFIKIFSFNGSGTLTNYLTTNPLSATITTPGGTTPAITSFTPASGSIGTSVTITGTNFSTTAANNIVKFNGTLATVIGTPTAISITTVVPIGATTGKITVEVSGQIATSATDFTVPTGWTTKASMITPRWGSGIGNIGDVAYVAGGYIPTNHLTTVEAYTVSSNSWVAKASRPTVQTSPAYGVINNILYTAGGTNSSVEISDLWSYNPSSDVWTSRTSLPAVRQASCGAVINGQFYVVGGRVGGISQSSLIVYDPTANTWSAKASMPTARTAAAAGVINGLLYVAGGIAAENNTVFSTLEVYDPIANTWTARASMPTARYGAAYEVLNGMLYVIGGNNSTQTVVSTVEAYNPTSNSWSTIPSLTFARAYAAAIVSNGSIFVTGGHSPANTAVSAMEQYGVSTATPTPTITSFNPTSGLVGSSVVITGTNFSTTAASNTVRFNGTTATVTGTPTASSITATVPVGATTGTLSVSVGGQTGTSSGTFTVTTASIPTVASFLPISGTIGTSVTLTGTGFSTTAANNIVKFNGTTATISGTPTATSITVTVPTGATTGKITVEVAGQTGTSLTDFTVNTVTLATEPTNSPTSLVFSGITSTSYSFNFTAAIAGTTAPDGYIGIRKTGSAPTAVLVDGVTYNVGDNLGDGNIRFIGALPGGGYVQTDGSPATTYHFTIYSYKGSGASINYKQVSPLAGSVTTLAASAAPAVASFLPISGTIGTSVTLTGTGFSTTAANNTVKFNGTTATITGTPTATSITVTVPTGATTGKITVEVAGQTGTSPLDFTVNVDTTPPTITGNTTVKTSKGGDPIKVSITAADAESGIASAVIYYGESTSFDWTKLDEPMTKVGANWEYTIPGNVVRELGVEYKVIVYNGVGDDADTGVLGITITTDANGPSVPFTGAGTAQSNYKIISIPLALESKTVNKIFGDDLGDYGDKSKWRMFRYSGERTSELNGSASINPGEAYWFISSTNAIIDTGLGTTVGRITDPFKIQVNKGFNQIGNPYAINLLWSDVQTYSFDTNDNGNLGLGKLRVFNGTGFDDGLVLKRFEGGFVMAAKSGTLVFPAEKNSAAGRTEVKPITTIANSIDGPDWEVNFELTNGIQAMNFGGIGMNKKASDEYDAYDDFTLPRFLDYIELNHAAKELYNLSYTKDIVPTAENHTWEFSVESNSNEVVTMKWDNSFFGNNSKQLVLWDVNLQKGLDMRTENQYLFSKSRSGSLKVFYGDEKYVKEKTAVSQLVFHDLFPNPARDNVTISFSLPSEDRVTIEVIDLLGKKIATVADGNFKEGYHEVTWNTLDTSGSAITNGIYITQIKGLKSDHQKRLSINK